MKWLLDDSLHLTEEERQRYEDQMTANEVDSLGIGYLRIDNFYLAYESEHQIIRGHSWKFT